MHLFKITRTEGDVCFSKALSVARGGNVNIDFLVRPEEGLFSDVRAILFCCNHRNIVGWHYATSTYKRECARVYVCVLGAALWIIIIKT